MDNRTLITALEDFKPLIAASFERIVRGQFERMVEKLGPALKNVANDWTFARSYSNTVARFVDRAGTRIEAACTLNEPRLAKASADYADAVVAEWLGKINEKLGELDEAEVRRLDGFRFNIAGKRSGRAVRIEQDMIVNVSSKGTLFNQFPARIYVDGKFTSAAAYKKLFAR